MGTQAVIARSIPGSDTWDGRHCDWDGYPSGVGKTLWDVYRTHFNRDLPAMIKFFTEDHTAWTSIFGKDFSQEPGYVDASNPETLCTVCQRPHWEHYAQYYEKRGLPAPGVIGGQFTVFDHSFEEPRNNRPECCCHGDRHRIGYWINRDGESYGTLYAYILGQRQRQNGSVAVLTIERITKISSGYEWRYLWHGSLDGEEPDWVELNTIRFDR